MEHFNWLFKSTICFYYQKDRSWRILQALCLVGSHITSCKFLLLFSFILCWELCSTVYCPLSVQLIIEVGRPALTLLSDMPGLVSLWEGNIGGGGHYGQYDMAQTYIKCTCLNQCSLKQSGYTLYMRNIILEAVDFIAVEFLLCCVSNWLKGIYSVPS